MPGDPAILKGVPATDLLMAVAVKLPQLWPENIETWFVQAEPQFRLNGVVVSQTKFDYIIKSMIAVQVLHLIRNPQLK